MKAKRSHWKIKNQVHWVLDIAFREEESRVRKDHSAENLAVLRHMALNLLKQEKTAKGGIHAKRIKPGYFNPPTGRPIFVPGFNWLQLLVTGLKGAPVLAYLCWWTTRGEIASQKREEKAKSSK